MEEKFEVGGAPVIYTNEKPPPYNPLHRPDVHFVKPIISLVSFAAMIALLVLFVPDDWPIPKWLIVVGAATVFLLLIAKRTIIWLVHLYQNRASDRTRLKCVFEPSCSEYMIMAVQKYGVFRGVAKGIDRLLRCHPPNGGEDLP